MAKMGPISVEVEMQVSEKTAESCRRILEMYSNQTGRVLLCHETEAQLSLRPQGSIEWSVEYYWREDDSDE